MTHIEILESSRKNETNVQILMRNLIIGFRYSPKEARKIAEGEVRKFNESLDTLIQESKDEDIS